MKLEFNELFDYVREKVSNNESVTVKEWSEHFNYDSSYFSRLFKKNIGISPVTYITAVRMEKTLESLLINDRTVTDSFSGVQYQSASSFSRNFKKYMGQSPEEFKKKSYELVEIVDVLIKREQTFELEYYDDKYTIVDEESSLKIKIKTPKGKTVPLLFVGIYKEPIALGNPIVGKALFYSNECVLENIPRGKYYVFVSAIENNTKKEDYFFARKLLKGCTSYPVLCPYDDVVKIEVREPARSDLPSVINFAKLIDNNVKELKF